LDRRSQEAYPRPVIHNASVLSGCVIGGIGVGSQDALVREVLLALELKRTTAFAPPIATDALPERPAAC
jgi:hypothetical protein